MNSPEPHDRLPLEWLAAYVDGELPATEAERVEVWLASHPEALEILEAQRDFSPSHTDLFELTPPRPATWDHVLANIEKAVPPRRPMPYLPAAAMGLIAASLLLVLTLPKLPVTSDQQVTMLAFLPPEREDEIGLIQLASEDEIEILSMPESASSLLITGKHPLASTTLTFASSSDIQILGMGSDSEGRFPELTTTSQPTEAVLLWAPRD
jgi:hypothetical protein